MPIKSPKNKGSAGEREIIDLLQSWSTEAGYPLVLERNLEQVRKGGSDVNGVPGLEIEVKRVEGNGINQWWKQVCAVSAKTGNRPFLCHRANRKPWRFRTYVWATEWTPGGQGQSLPIVVDLGLHDAQQWFTHYLMQRLKELDHASTT